MRYSKGAVLGGPSHWHTAELSLFVIASGEAQEWEIKALWEGEASSVQSRVRKEEGYSNIYMSLYSKIPP